VSHNFAPSGTRGFKAAGDTADGNTATAICLKPGTELKFEEDVRYYVYTPGAERPDVTTVRACEARFTQVNKDKPDVHHDALEFATGEQILLTHLVEGQHARVLQLPAKPKTAAERENQRRAEHV
jgi:hypothetical protein